MLKNSQLQAHPPALPGGLEYALLSKGKKQIDVQNSQTLNLSLVLLTLILSDSDGERWRTRFATSNTCPPRCSAWLWLPAGVLMAPRSTPGWSCPRRQHCGPSARRSARKLLRPVPDSLSTISTVIETAFH